MIVHRLKTVRDAEQIQLLEDGKIIPQENYDRLSNKDGVYRNFINIQKESLGWRIAGEGNYREKLLFPVFSQLGYFYSHIRQNTVYFCFTMQPLMLFFEEYSC